MYFAAVICVSLIASANALVTPHIPGGFNRRSHGSIVKARAADPAPAPAPVGEASAAIPRRQITKRCKARPTPTSATLASSSAAPPQNVAPLPLPVSVSISVPSVSTTASPSPKPSPTTAKPNPPAPKPSSSSQAPAPAPSSPSGGSSSDAYTGSHSGDGTFYATGLGACGITNKDSDSIVAISEILFDEAPDYNGVNPNSNPLCGKHINVEYQGKTATVEVTDRCTGCSKFSLDFAPSVFDILADPSVGRIHNVQWSWA